MRRVAPEEFNLQVHPGDAPDAWQASSPWAISEESMKKVKGITIWEQFAEFILLGAVIVIFVFYIFSQLSSSTNAVRIDGQDMNPSEIDDALRGKAESLSRAIADDATPRVEIEQPPAKLPQFEEMIASSIMPAETSPLPSPIVAIDTEQGAGVSSQAYVVPEVPPTQAPVARQFFDGIEPSVVEGWRSGRIRVVGSGCLHYIPGLLELSHSSPT